VTLTIPAPTGRLISSTRSLSFQFNATGQR
jgi:hypothetical protein